MAKSTKIIAAVAMSLAIEAQSGRGLALFVCGEAFTLGPVWKQNQSNYARANVWALSRQGSDDHGHYMHAEETTTVNMSTSNSFSRLVPNRPSHLS
jgi:hypothetical protein